MSTPPETQVNGGSTLVPDVPDVPEGELPSAAPAPHIVSEMAQACVRFVRAALGVELDFSIETLPVLDHYVGTRREDLIARPETIGLVARAAGAYFGEVVRRQIPSFWHLGSEDEESGGPGAVPSDPSTWELRFEPVYLMFNPLAVAYDAITYGDEEGPTAHLQLDDEDRGAVEARLADLPSASDEEFFSFSTRLEVLQIAVEAIKSRMMGGGLGEVVFSSEDYDEDSM